MLGQRSPQHQQRPALPHRSTRLLRVARTPHQGSGPVAAAAAKAAAEAAQPPGPDLPSSRRRRSLLQAAVALPVAWAWLPPDGCRAVASATMPGAGGASRSRYAELLQRATTSGSLWAPGPRAPWESKQVYYPRWMFGQWAATATFTALATPLGPQFAPQGILAAAQADASAGGIGSVVTYDLRFFSTLPDTLGNQLRMNLGFGLPEDAIIQDRAFNTRAVSNAYLGWQAVEYVEYDPREAPDRETVVFARLTPSMRPLPPKRTELYIQRAQAAEATADEAAAAGGSAAFLTSEMCRQVVLGMQQVSVARHEAPSSCSWPDVCCVHSCTAAALAAQPAGSRMAQCNRRLDVS